MPVAFGTVNGCTLLLFFFFKLYSPTPIMTYWWKVVPSSKFSSMSFSGELLSSYFFSISDELLLLLSENSTPSSFKYASTCAWSSVHHCGTPLPNFSASFFSFM
jgi:hypothetical protein